MKTGEQWKQITGEAQRSANPPKVSRRSPEECQSIKRILIDRKVVNQSTKIIVELNWRRNPVASIVKLLVELNWRRNPVASIEKLLVEFNLRRSPEECWSTKKKGHWSIRRWLTNPPKIIVELNWQRNPVVSIAKLLVELSWRRNPVVSIVKLLVELN